ncbi:MAG: hypothetical protein SVY53_05235 [Chloroflexota bacterium]|nr:hypothetical protein [Chloroflexota bacterium]
MNKNRRCLKCDGIVRDDGDYLCVNCRVETLIDELDCAMLRLRCIKEDLEKQLERLNVDEEG